jgi:hypothetical protein
MGDFAVTLARLMAERGLGVRELARLVPCNPGHLSSLRSGKAQASPELARAIDRALNAGGELAAAALPHVVMADDDEIEAIELGRRAEASDVGGSTLSQLEAMVDSLAIAYPSTAPADLLPRVRAHLRYVGGLMDARATLTQRRRLLVTGGWLSLLAATLLIDQRRDPAAGAYLRTARSLAREAGHDELAAWCIETRAWQVLTAGEYREAVELSQAAQQIAPNHSSAHIQTAAQEGRAWARLGEAAPTRAALATVERLVSPLPRPERPEHHWVFDPQKARVYMATTLAWVGDPAAVRAARDILAALEDHGADPPRPRRIALARLDLALALVTAGKQDEAAAVATQAAASGRLAPVDGPRIREIVAAVSGRGVPEARELTEAYRALALSAAPEEL